MAYTSADLVNIEAAIKTGELSVSIGDRHVTYRSMADLLRARDVIKQDINSGVFVRTSYVKSSKG